ncbi:MAG: hypothetical protein WAT93_00425 [Pontixanthobacter sp.]
MTDYDFSHLFDKSYVLADTISKGFKVTDESWLSTIEQIEPKLLSKSDMEGLRWVLDHTTERRGGKSIQAVAQGLIEKLEITERADLPTVFMDELIERLRSGKRYTRRESDRAYSKPYRRGDRDRIIVFLYDYIYDELADDPRDRDASS